MSLQPVIPFALGGDWNVVSRSSIAFVHQVAVIAGDSHQSGLTNATESLFLSPRVTRVPGLTWGVGPIVALPATDRRLGSRQLGLGPTVAIIHTVGPVTYGVLLEQVWSLGGAPHAYVQPQVAWTMSEAGTTVRARSEATYEWGARTWTVPAIIDLAQPVAIGHQAVELSAGVIAYLARPEDAPSWGIRVSLTLVSP